LEVVIVKVKIVYFSGTGNTRLVAGELKKNFDSVSGSRTELIPVEEAKPGRISGAAEENILGIGFPVYDLLPPDIISDFIRSLPEKNRPQPVFLFSTYATMPLNCLIRTALMLAERNYRVIAGRDFRAPAPTRAFYMSGGEEDVEKKRGFKKGINAGIREFVMETVRKFEKFPDDTDLFSMRQKPFHRFWFGVSQMTFGNLFYRNLKINDACINCGKCVSVCPDGNLKAGEKRPHVVKDNGCLRCLRCVQTCPVRAVNFTSARRRGDYTLKKGEELFLRAFETADTVREDRCS
jgi:ferredoxin